MWADHRMPEYTSELLNVLNVPGLLIDLEPRQADVLGRVMAGDPLSYDGLRSAGTLDPTAAPAEIAPSDQSLFEGLD